MTAIALTPINLLDLIDPKKCYALIRSIRWGEIVICPKCGSHHVIKRGFDETQGIAKDISASSAKLALMT